MISHNTLIPTFYEGMDELVQPLLLKCLTDVLEIGCGDGRYVKYLRGLGYSAIGIDGQLERLSKEGIAEGYLFPYYTDDAVQALKGNYGMVIVNRCMSRGSTISTIAERGFQIPLDMLSEVVIELTQGNVEAILETSFQLLQPGGYFVASEDPQDKFALQQNDALRYNFEVIQLTAHNAILQKPLKTSS